MTTPDLTVFTGEHLIDQIPPDGWEFVKVQEVQRFQDNVMADVSFRHTLTGTVAKGTVYHIAPIPGRTKFVAHDRTMQDPTQGEPARMTIETPDTSAFTGDHLFEDQAPGGWTFIGKYFCGVTEKGTVERVVFQHEATGTYVFGVFYEDTDTGYIAFDPLENDADPLDFTGRAKMTPAIRETAWTETPIWRAAADVGTPIAEASRTAGHLRVLEMTLEKIKAQIDDAKAELADTLDAGQHDLGPVKVTVTVPKRLDTKAAAQEWTLEDHPEMWVCPDPKIDTKALAKHVAPVDLEPFKKAGAPIVKVVDQT